MSGGVTIDIGIVDAAFDVVWSLGHTECPPALFGFVSRWPAAKERAIVEYSREPYVDTVCLLVDRKTALRERIAAGQRVPSVVAMDFIEGIALSGPPEMMAAQVRIRSVARPCPDTFMLYGTITLALDRAAVMARLDAADIHPDDAEKVIALLEERVARLNEKNR